MKNLLTTIILGIALAGGSFAQSSSKPRIAVLEFSTGPNASAMTAEAKRQLQSSIAFALVKKQDFEVPDVRNTRAATGSGDVGTSAAVRRERGICGPCENLPHA